MLKILIITLGLLMIGANAYASDVSIDSNGNVITGDSNSKGNLKVIGSSGQDGIVGTTNGTGAAGVYGENSTFGNYGKLGDYSYGVYGYSLGGDAGYFNGNARVTGNLTVDGTLQGNHDHDASYVNEGQAGSVTSSMITDGTIQQIDMSFALGDGHSLDAADGVPADVIYVNNAGNVGVGTTNPAGKVDVNGDICLGGVCRTSWPSGSGTGAFTDTGSSAYYNGGNVGIGTVSPQGQINVDSRVVHMFHTAAPTGDSAVGLRLELDGVIDAGIMSAYNPAKSAGLFVGTLSNHRVAFGTNGTEQVTLSPNGNLSIKSGSLGVGVPTPLQPLHIQGNAYVYSNLGVGIDSPTHKLEVSGADALMSSSSGDFRLLLSKNLTSNHASLVFQHNYTGYAELGLTGDNNFHFKVSPDGTTFSDAFMIDNSNGFIGIGTMVPESMLNIVSDSEPPLYVEDIGSAAFSAFFWKKGDGDAVSIRKQSGTGTALLLFQGTSEPAMVVRNVTSDIFVIESSGNVGIGTSTPQAKLDVNGKIYQRGGVLHADYVFEPNYKLESIQEHADFMWKSKHLKAMPKAAVDENGKEIVEVGSYRRGIVEELEKAHIYIEQLLGQINHQNRQLKLLEDRMAKIEAGNY